MNKSLLLRLAIIVFIIPYSGLASAQYLYPIEASLPYLGLTSSECYHPYPLLESYVVYGADGKTYQYGYPVVNLNMPVYRGPGCYNVCEGSYGCMTLQYGDARNGCKPTRCPSCVNSGCCNCRCARGGCTRR